MNRHILVGGGTGFIGRHLVKLLKSKDYDVTIVSRKPSRNSISWDSLSKNGLPVDSYSVVNLAGENVLNFTKRWNKSFQQQVYDSRINTTKILASTINESINKPKSFISISGVGIYPPSETCKYDEYSEVKEFDFFSKLCHDWEKASDLKPSSCKVANIRSGVVLGREGGMIKDLYLPFSLGLGGPIGSGKQYLPWIHIEDLTKLILHCIENQVAGKINGVAPEPVTNSQFTKAFAKSLSRPAILPVPEFVFNLLFGRERAIMVTQGQCVLPKRTLEIGYKYKFPNIQSACDSFVKK